MPRTASRGSWHDAAVAVALRVHQPVEAVADADDVPPAVAPGEHDGADHGVEPGSVAAARRHGDALDRTRRFLHEANSTSPAAGPRRTGASAVSGDRGDGELVDEVVEAIAAVPLHPAERHGLALTRATSGAHRSALATGLRADVRHPLASHLAHQRSRKQLTT